MRGKCILMPRSPLRIDEHGRYQFLSRSPTAEENRLLLGLDSSPRQQTIKVGRFTIKDRSPGATPLRMSKKYVMDRAAKMTKLNEIGKKLSRLEGEYRRTRQEYDTLYGSIVGARDEGTAQKGKNITFRRSEARGVSKRKKRRSRRRRR